MTKRIRSAAGMTLVAVTLAGCDGGGGSTPEIPSMKVRATSGAMYDLTNTTWAECEAGYPAPGQSYAHSYSFGAGTATTRHDVHTASTDCTGATDPAEHFEVTANIGADGGDRTVGWEGGTAPSGYPATEVATGVSFSGVTFPDGASSKKGVALVDDAQNPAVIFITNAGDPTPPLDADGYPTELPTAQHVRQ